MKSPDADDGSPRARPHESSRSLLGQRAVHVDQPDQDVAAGKPATDLSALLFKYTRAQRLLPRPPASITLPTRDPGRRILRRVHMGLRPTWFSERWMARQLRRRADVLERGMAERLALGGDPTPQELSDREALR